MTKWVRPGNCFHCYGRIWKLTVFTVLEESGNSLFSLLWKNLEARHCFDCFGRIWKHTVFTVLFWKNLEAHCFHCTVLEESGSSLFSLFWKNLEAHRFHCFHCLGKIWKLTVFTNFSLFGGGVSQKIVKSASFQILPKQWKQWTLFCGLNHFVAYTWNLLPSVLAPQALNSHLEPETLDPKPQPPTSDHRP